MNIVQSAALIVAGIVVAAPALAQSEPEGDRVEVNGMEMYYEVSGQGDPMIVLHGAHMNIDTMGEIIPTLAQTHTVYAIEFQGHGRTNDIDRPINYPNLASDVAAFMDAVGIEKADVFGYSMGAAAGLKFAIDYPERIDQLIAASTSFTYEGMQEEYLAMVPEMGPEMFEFFEEGWTALAPDPEGFDAFIEKMIALEHEPFDWTEDVANLQAPVLIIAGDADVVTLEHSVDLFNMLGGGVMGDMGVPLPQSRLAIMPATSHTAVISQTDLLYAFIEPFLAGETPAGFFEE